MITMAASWRNLIGAITMAFGTHVTPLAIETMRPHPSLDYCLRGEPEMTLREVVDTIERTHRVQPGNPEPV